MSQIQPNSQTYNLQTGTPLYNYAYNSVPQGYVAPQQQTVSVASPATSQVYQYPETSLYNNPSKQPASGVNIYIYNPSAIGGPSSNSTANANYTLPANSTTPAVAQAQAPNVTPQQSVSIANTPISGNTENTEAKSPEQKTKKVVELTDDYIKTLESYLRSPDKTIRNTGIKELINRFEEDDSRYDDEALTALLNIALQDPDANNRLFAMSPITAGSAHGDSNTVEILKNLQNSDKLYGQEALMANSALLKASQTMMTIPDNSPEKKDKKDK